MRASVVAAALAVSVEAVVEVKFFGESLCPDCIQFMGGTANSTLEDPDMMKIMKFDYYPWGAFCTAVRVRTTITLF